MGKIVWLASYPKSGNTWLRVFIHNLLRNPAKPFSINELKKFTMADTAARRFMEFDSRPYNEWTKEDVAVLRPKVLERMTQVFPDLVFVKTHNALVLDCGTPTIAMEHTAGAIYVVRNPLDIAASLGDHTGITVDQAIEQMEIEYETEISSQNVHEIRGSWSSHVKSWTAHPHPGLHVYRYEDALDDPFRVFSGVAKFLGLNPPPERIEKAIRFSSFETLREQEDDEGFRERTAHQKNFFRSGRAGTWRDELTREQIDRIVDKHRAQMTRFGYLPDGEPGR